MSNCPTLDVEKGTILSQKSPPTPRVSSPTPGEPPSPVPPPTPRTQSHTEERLYKGWNGNSRDSLLVVSTLITALTYQIGTNPPGGFWQDDEEGHHAGNLIMKDKHRNRYWLFLAASWIGFIDSMLVTLGLLTGREVDSRWVRWPFAISYSSLQLTFITSVTIFTSDKRWIPQFSVILDLVSWAIVLLVSFAATCMNRHKKTS